jgi:hypothetical protein
MLSDLPAIALMQVDQLLSWCRGAPLVLEVHDRTAIPDPPEFMITRPPDSAAEVQAQQATQQPQAQSLPPAQQSMSGAAGAAAAAAAAVAQQQAPPTPPPQPANMLVGVCNSAECLGQVPCLSE